MPTPLDERLAFQLAIGADRYDQVTRLVFADWLDEHDSPEEAQKQRAWTVTWQKSEDYVREFCQNVDLNYSYFLEAARSHLATGAAIECTMTTSNETMDVDHDELWRQVGILLGVEIESSPVTDPFTCSTDCYPDGLSWGDDAPCASC